MLSSLSSLFGCCSRRATKEENQQSIPNTSPPTHRSSITQVALPEDLPKPLDVKPAVRSSEFLEITLEELLRPFDCRVAVESHSSLLPVFAEIVTNYAYANPVLEKEIVIIQCYSRELQTNKKHEQQRKLIEQCLKEGNFMCHPERYEQSSLADAHYKISRHTNGDGFHACIAVVSKPINGCQLKYFQTHQKDNQRYVFAYQLCILNQNIFELLRDPLLTHTDSKDAVFALERLPGRVVRVLDRKADTVLRNTVAPLPTPVCR